MSETTKKLNEVQAHIKQIANLLGSDYNLRQHFSALEKQQRTLTREEKKQQDYEQAVRAWFNNVNIEQVENAFSDCIENGPETNQEEEEDPDPFPKHPTQGWSQSMHNGLLADPEITRLFGVMLSTSKKHDVDASEIQDHLDMPAYPDTSPEGIVHFIKINPRSYPHDVSSKDEETRQKGFKKLAANMMSKIRDPSSSVKLITSPTFAPESIIVNMQIRKYLQITFQTSLGTIFNTTEWILQSSHYYIKRTLKMRRRKHQQRSCGTERLRTALAGIQREFELDLKRPEDERWIREICYLGVKKDISRYVVICMTKKQAEAFRDCAHIQMDLSFKMVHGQTNLYSVVGLNEITNEIETFAYIFLNWETTQAYYQLFCRLFYWLGVVSGTPVRFKHIQGTHQEQAGTPVSTATLDMCKKQAHGLGQYLEGLDPSKSWQEHLLYIVIFCKVHLRRGFHSRFPRCNLGAFLDQIFGSPSQARLLEVISAAIRLYPETKDWWENKLPSWLQGGLCQACSKIDPVDWSNALKHTGINESEHFMVNNFTGRSISFLMAVKLLHKFIKNREERLAVYEKHGIFHRQKNMSTEAYFVRKIRDWNGNYRKQAERRERNPLLSFNPSNAFDSTDIVPDQSETGPRPLLGLDDLLQQAGNINPASNSEGITQAENELSALSDQWMDSYKSLGPDKSRGRLDSNPIQDQSVPVELLEPELPEYPSYITQNNWEDRSESDLQLFSQDIRSSPPPLRRPLQSSPSRSGEGTILTHLDTISRSSQHKRGHSEVSITTEGISEAELAEKEKRIKELRQKVAEKRARAERISKARRLEEEERGLLEELGWEES
ncbi:hypothetical protein F4781DRAFT_434338 [Annulohypoxylon bovei var. microspora]|nr:hypothetical protein F4781DRAFT_434338 [Annulohypoxylon bovei var. microspora]